MRFSHCFYSAQWLMMFLLFTGVQYWFHNTVYKKQLHLSEGGIEEEPEFLMQIDTGPDMTHDYYECFWHGSARAEEYSSVVEYLPCMASIQ